MIIKVTNLQSEPLDVGHPIGRTIPVGGYVELGISEFDLSHGEDHGDPSWKALDHLGKTGAAQIEIVGDPDVSGVTAISQPSIPLARTRYVDVSPTAFVPDGSFGLPYPTIQAAVDDIEANLSPSYANPVAVVIASGVYDETVEIHGDGVCLVGIGGQGLCRIRPTIGPALVLSNATKASLAIYLAGGLYSGLVNQGDKGPWDHQSRNIDFAPVENDAWPVMCIGVKGDQPGDKTSFGGNELNFMMCSLRSGNSTRSFWARNMCYAAVQSGSWCAGEIYVQNIAGIWCNDGEFKSYHGVYEAADPEGQPNDTGNYGLAGGKSVFRGNVILEKEARIGFDKLWGGVIEGNVDCDDTSAFKMIGGVIEGNVDCEGGASFTAQGLHVQGNLAFASGVGTAQMDGGRYMGSLTDPDGKFIFYTGAVSAEPTSTFYVDKDSTEIVENGSQELPFKTIQAAIDHVKALAVTPPFGSPATIAIMSGKYAENLVISKDDLGIAFMGIHHSAGNNIYIEPATGAGMIIHNATPASLATYLSTGVYSDLVNAGGPGPSRVALQSVVIGGEDGILALGVKGDDTANTTDFLKRGIFLNSVRVSAIIGHSFFAKNLAYIYLENSRFPVKPIVCQEVGFIISWNTAFEADFSVEYDPADPDGWSSTSSLGVHAMQSSHAYFAGTPNVTVGIGVTWKPQNCIVGGNVTVNDTGEIDAGDLIIRGNLDVNGASGDVSALGITIGGNLTMTVGKTATLNAPHIAGAVTLDNGAGAVVLNGGEYMGALTDVGVRLTRNVGA